MELPPLGGAVFIFFSKNRQQVKMLKWDGDGFLAVPEKRLERGTFELPFFLTRIKYMQNAVQDTVIGHHERNLPKDMSIGNGLICRGERLHCKELCVNKIIKINISKSLQIPDFLYLCTMKKDEIIVLLKEQLQLANEQLQQANATTGFADCTGSTNSLNV